MKLRTADIDLIALRPALILFGCCLLLGGTLLAISFGFRNGQLDQMDSARAELRRLVTGYRDAVRAEYIVRTQYSRYQALQARGFVGEEPRLWWIENLRELGVHTGVPAIRYQLEHRRPQPGPLLPVTGEASLDDAALQLFASPMQLRLDLHHEVELLDFLDLLEARAIGLFDIERCDLQRLHNDTEPKLDAANLRAECRLLWFTIGHTTAATEEFL